MEEDIATELIGKARKEIKNQARWVTSEVVGERSAMLGATVLDRSLTQPQSLTHTVHVQSVRNRSYSEYFLDMVYIVFTLY
jgi:hypothetical protein